MHSYAPERHREVSIDARQCACGSAVGSASISHSNKLTLLIAGPADTRGVEMDTQDEPEFEDVKTEVLGMSNISTICINRIAARVSAQHAPWHRGTRSSSHCLPPSLSPP